MTQEMLNLQWNANSLYPAGVITRNIQAQATVTLPPGWSYATALDTERREGGTVVFKPISYDHLVDSPLFAGRHYQQFDLDPDARIVALDVGQLLAGALHFGTGRCHLAANCCCDSLGSQPLSQLRGTPESTRMSP